MNTDQFALLDRQALDFFIDLQGGLNDAIRETARNDLAETEALADRLVSACVGRDFRAARREAHDLIGLAATYGLDRMSRTAEAIGFAIRGNDFPQALSLAAALDAIILPSISAVKKALEAD